MFALQFLPPIFFSFSLYFPFSPPAAITAVAVAIAIVVATAAFLHIKYVQTFSINICVKNIKYEFCYGKNKGTPICSFSIQHIFII